VFLCPVRLCVSIFVCICLVWCVLCLYTCVCVCALLLLPLPRHPPGLRQDYASVAPRPERRRSPSCRTPPLLSHKDEDEVFGPLSPPRPLGPSNLPRLRAFSSALDTPPDTPPTSPIPTCTSGPFPSPPVRPSPVGPGPARSQDCRPGSGEQEKSPASHRVALYLSYFFFYRWA